MINEIFSHGSLRLDSEDSLHDLINKIANDPGNV
jgi:hypothetical protein